MREPLRAGQEGRAGGHRPAGALRRRLRARARAAVELPELPPTTGKRVAVVGAGPAGLTVAGDLVRQGHEVTVFEALHKPGGVLIYGIPEFRLPKEIVQREVDYLRAARASSSSWTTWSAGTTPCDELLDEEGFDAVFIGTGAGLPSFLGIPGENLIGVYSANEYLTRVNLMKAYHFPEYDTPPIRRASVSPSSAAATWPWTRPAPPCAWAPTSTIVYRRAREEMPARDEEIHHAEEEGVDVQAARQPDARSSATSGTGSIGDGVHPDGAGRARRLRPPPARAHRGLRVHHRGRHGRRRHRQQAQSAAAADHARAGDAPRWGTIVVDEHTMQTSMPGVFAGGDIVTGAATVILAMGQGRNAARAIDRYLRGEPLKPERPSAPSRTGSSQGVRRSLVDPILIPPGPHFSPCATKWSGGRPRGGPVTYVPSCTRGAAPGYWTVAREKHGALTFILSRQPCGREAFRMVQVG